MPEILIEKLYAKDTAQGHLAVYQTEAFGLLLTLNEHILLAESDGFFSHEMLAHPALFLHDNASKVAIIGTGFGVLTEVLKHAHINEVHCAVLNADIDAAIATFFPDLYTAKNDARVHWHYSDSNQWLQNQTATTFDIIIEDQPEHLFLREHYEAYVHVLTASGILIQACQASLFHLKTIKPILQNVRLAGFKDCHTLNFPQASYSNGWRTAIIATKHPMFRHVSEKDVYNRTFPTRYYNFDTHKAAFALPEFIRQELEAELN